MMERELMEKVEKKLKEMGRKNEALRARDQFMTFKAGDCEARVLDEVWHEVQKVYGDYKKENELTGALALDSVRRLLIEHYVRELNEWLKMGDALRNTVGARAKTEAILMLLFARELEYDENAIVEARMELRRLEPRA